MPKRNNPTQETPPGRGREAFLLFSFALLLRLLGIGWGLPNAQHFFSYHPDEVYVVAPALDMLEGDWNPHFFNYGTLYIYLIGLTGKIFAGLGFLPAQSEDLGLLHLIARGLTALLGAGTVLLLYLVGRELGGRRLALLGAFLLAVAPLHLINSHYATVDVPGTFFLLLCGAASVKIIAAGKGRWYLLAIAAAGLAAATKYPLGFSLVLPFAAHWLRGREAASEHLKLLLFFTFPLFFLVGCPYALSFAGGLHFRPEFLADFLFEVRHMREIRTPGFLGTGSGWNYHALRGFPAGLGIPLYLLSLCGVGLALSGWLAKSQGLASKTYFLFALWSVLFFLVIGRATEQFIRYLVPFTPFLALLAAGALEKLLTLHSSLGRKIALSLVGAGLALTLAYAGSQLYLLMKEDPRDQALRSFFALSPASVGIPEIVWFQTAPISPFNAGQTSRDLFAQWQKTAPYHIIITGWEKEVLFREAPQSYIISDLQYSDFLRLKINHVRELLAALANSYNQETRFANPAFLDWVGGGKAIAPPDWLYLKPTITLYSDWQVDNQ